MAYNYYPYNPYQQNSLLWVRNSNEAMMYPVAPNNAVALWDSSSPVIYLKQADASGRPSMKTFDLTERTERPTESVSPSEGKELYATKNDLAALVGLVTRLENRVLKLEGEEDE